MKKLKYSLAVVAVFLLVIMSNLYLQWCQNNLSLDLVLKFAFSWHTAKFFLGSLVLLAVYGVFAAIAGSLLFGGLFYSVAIGLLGFADYQKMTARQEPIYPDDLKMIGQLGVLKDMVGAPIFILAVVAILLAIVALGYSIYRSRKLSRNGQIFRGVIFLLSLFFLVYAS
ncbi:MAG: LTA synthase family protein, partial [Enterococcus sp.]